MSAWQPIETAPRKVTVVGLRRYGVGVQPAFVGEVYGLNPAFLIDRWTGRYCECSHWIPLPEAPETSA